MTCQFHWLRKPEYPEETTDLRQATEETFTPMALRIFYVLYIDKWTVNIFEKSDTPVQMLHFEQSNNTLYIQFFPK